MNVLVLAGRPLVSQCLMVVDEYGNDMHQYQHFLFQFLRHTSRLCFKCIEKALFLNKLRSVVTFLQDTEINSIRIKFTTTSVSQWSIVENGCTNRGIVRSNHNRFFHVQKLNTFINTSCFLVSRNCKYLRVHAVEHLVENLSIQLEF